MKKIKKSLLALFLIAGALQFITGCSVSDSNVGANTANPISTTVQGDGDLPYITSFTSDLPGTQWNAVNLYRIEVVFSEDMDPATVTAANMYLRNLTGGTPADIAGQAVTYDATTKTAYIDYTNDGTIGTAELVVTAGVTDKSGNGIAGLYMALAGNVDENTEYEYRQTLKALDQNVVYNGDGSTAGSAPATISYAQNEVVTIDGPNTLVRTSYTFTGWSTEPNGAGTIYTEGQTFIMGRTQTINLYAVWTPDASAAAHTITFDPDTAAGGVGGPTLSHGMTSGSTVVIPGNVYGYTNVGDEFIGWSTGLGGTGTTYTEGQTMTMGSANTTLYAKWAATASTYTVTYSAAGSSGGAAPVSNQRYQSGNNVIIQQNINGLYRTGYYLAGWCTTADLQSTLYQPGQTYAVTGNVTFYPKWVNADYTPAVVDWIINHTDSTHLTVLVYFNRLDVNPAYVAQENFTLPAGLTLTGATPYDETALSTGGFIQLNCLVTANTEYVIAYNPAPEFALTGTYEGGTTVKSQMQILDRRENTRGISNYVFTFKSRYTDTINQQPAATIAGATPLSTTGDERSTITVNFSKAMQAASVLDTNNYQIYKEDGGSCQFTIKPHYTNTNGVIEIWSIDITTDYQNGDMIWGIIMKNSILSADGYPLDGDSDGSLVAESGDYNYDGYIDDWFKAGVY